MARPANRKEKSRQAAERRHERHRTAAERATARRQVIAIVVAAALVLSSGGAVLAVIIGSLADDGPTVPATTSVPTAPTAPVGQPATLAFPAPGASADDPVPCPGPGAPRTTSFAGAAPVCVATTADGAIDTSVDYLAVISTTAGDLTYLLTTERAPASVNNFVVLARYGYWDGAPFDVITPLAWAEVGASFDGAPRDPDATGAQAGPGWVVPRESPEQGMVSTPGMLGMATDPDGSSQAGRLLVALGDGAANLPVATTFFGVMLDGTATLAAIQRAGGADGRPTAAVVVTGITVEPTQ